MHNWYFTYEMRRGKTQDRPLSIDVGKANSSIPLAGIHTAAKAHPTIGLVISSVSCRDHSAPDSIVNWDLLKVGHDATDIFLLALQPPWARAFSFSFIIIFTDRRTSWASDQLVARPLPKHRTTQSRTKHTHTHETYMTWVGFKSTIPEPERAKTVHALNRSATVTGRTLQISIRNYHHSSLLQLSAFSTVASAT
jgi:hypothetical protein